ncbi:hypothetical protein ACJQWK_05062 [Exserohilum turcicum]|uniref:Uncharacterized protein n=1 Tax=Exserohilum turcicum (strain 28A) TaxID=671987 RepID=R0K0S9_EXST2|nr:uncharacterized protein SETTUDRAFT_43970 [Exserohilum turcica Et28A]EOA82037.1 hypothetical protein SETTUDRAFT_43970 [Exserohilum turcica Et28A]
MASKEAQKLFDRRRTGLDRKARDLIMKSLSMHNVDLGITIIYEFGEEVSMFRSHLDDGRWWSTVQDLKNTCGKGITGMGVINEETRGLWEWQVHQERKKRPQSNFRNPRSGSDGKRELPEEILRTSRGLLTAGPADDSEDDGSGDETSNDKASEGNETPETSADEDDPSDDDDDDEEPIKTKQNVRQRKQPLRRVKSTGGSYHGSPKRPREDDAMSMQWSMSDPPPQQPLFQYSPNFNNYTHNPNSNPNGQFTSLPNHPAPALSMLQQGHNPITVHQPDIYNSGYAPELGFGAHIYQEPMQTGSMGSRPVQIPEVPQPKKAKRSKSTSAVTKKRTSKRFKE